MHTTSTQPTNLVKNEPQTSENSVQKVLDYNSISEDEKNESAVDMMLRKSTTTTTEQTTTPEPRNYTIKIGYGVRDFTHNKIILIFSHFRFLHCAAAASNRSIDCG